MRTREEQIAEIKERAEDWSLVNYYPDFSEIQDWMIEAERRAEQRVRAEIARDSERLDWLADAVSSIGGKNGDPVVWKIMFTTQGQLTGSEHIRNAIDTAREVG